MIYISFGFPDFPGQKYGPALFPQVVCSGMLICGALLVYRGLGARRNGGQWVELADWTRDSGNILSFALLLGLVVFYILFSEQIGFIPITFGILLVLFLWLRVRLITALIVAPTATLVVHWFFADLLRVPLPRGLLLHIL